jgi:hypothetical protein
VEGAPRRVDPVVGNQLRSPRFAISKTASPGLSYHAQSALGETFGTIQRSSLDLG